MNRRIVGAGIMSTAAIGEAAAALMSEHRGHTYMAIACMILAGWTAVLAIALWVDR